MAAGGAPLSSLRQMPVKVTTAPISRRPWRSFAASLAASNGSRCSRMVAPISVSDMCPALAPRHRREESDFARAQNGRVAPHMRPVDRRADHLRILERVGGFLAPAAEPRHELRDRRDAPPPPHPLLPPARAPPP